VISGLSVGANSPVNVNLRQPAMQIYPKKEKDDAPYSLSEAEMRAQIHIPSGFTYGKVQPIIMVPGMFGVFSRHLSFPFIPAILSLRELGLGI